jgi:purine-binding chemotaxis protein CheW
VASDDQIKRQRDVLLAQAMSAAPSSGTQEGVPTDARTSQRGSRASVAALQSQLAQLTQARAERAAPTTQPNVVNGEQYLVFSLLDRELAFKAEYIQGVERLIDVTPVPNVVSWIKGVINLRGSIASVVDLRAFLGLESLAYNPRTRLLSVHYNEMIICLVVDGVSEMVPISPSFIAPVSTRQSNVPLWVAPYAAGFALLNQQRPIVLLDAARLLFSDKMQHYQVLS